MFADVFFGVFFVVVVVVVFLFRPIDAFNTF